MRRVLDFLPPLMPVGRGVLAADQRCAVLQKTPTTTPTVVGRERSVTPVPLEAKTLSAHAPRVSYHPLRRLQSVNAG